MKKLYTVTVTCEYDVEVCAESTEEAEERAIDAHYEIYHLNNFEYNAYYERDVEDDYQDSVEAE